MGLVGVLLELGRVSWFKSIETQDREIQLLACNNMYIKLTFLLDNPCNTIVIHDIFGQVLWRTNITKMIIGISNEIVADTTLEWIETAAQEGVRVTEK